MNVIDSVDFHCGGAVDVSGVLGNLKELQNKRQDEMGLLEFYKIKGWRSSFRHKRE